MSDVKRWVENPVNGGPEVVLASAYDALAAAAGRVTCAMCGGEGTIPDWPPDNSVLDASCPDCAELRKLLEGDAHG